IRARRSKRWVSTNWSSIVEASTVAAFEESADGSTEAHLRLGYERRIPPDALRLEEHDDRGAHVEAAKLLAFRERAADAFLNRDDSLASSRRRIHFAAMNGFDAAHEKRADEDDRHAPDGRVEVADEPFVAGEDARDGAHRRRVHAKQIAWNVGVAANRTVERHVNSMVIVRREVKTSETAASIRLDRFTIAGQEVRERIGVSLRLDECVVLQMSALAHRAVDGTHDELRIGSDRAHAGTQRAREKFVEAPVGIRIRLLRLAHVDSVACEKG